MKRPRIGLALGSGSARGWSHIGVIRELERLGVRPDIVAGTSIGALVGGAYMVDRLDSLETWIRSLDRMDILKLLDARLTGGGFMRGEKLMKAIAGKVSDVAIESLERPFACVATDLHSGQEIWLDEGSLLDAVRASIALPGLFSPVRRGDQWLVDGGLVNPVPVSLCRALGADVVIAVNLNGDLISRNADNQFPRGRQGARPEQDGDSAPPASHKHPAQRLVANLAGRLKSGLRVRMDRLIASISDRDEDDTPGLFDVLAGSINVVQDRITRSRMAGDPPDVMISPRLGQIRLMEFDRAAEAIDGGKEAVDRVRDEILTLVGKEPPADRS